MFKDLKENMNILIREIEDIKNNQVELLKLNINTWDKILIKKV